MNFNFGEILTRAGQLIWRQRVLWLFGFLAGCGQSSGSSFRFNSSSFKPPTSSDPFPTLPPEAEEWFRRLQPNLVWVSQHLWLVFLIVITFVLGVWIITDFFNVVGKVGLIRGTFQAERQGAPLVAGQLFNEGVRYFWRMIGLAVFSDIPGLIGLVALTVGFVLFLANANTGPDSGEALIAGAVTFVGSVAVCACLLIPVIFVARLIIRQAENALVLEDLSIWPAFQRGWQVFRNHLGQILIMEFLLIAIQLVAGLIISIPGLVILTPLLVGWVMSGGQASLPLPAILAGICLIVPISLFLTSIMHAYIESTWTLTYLQLTQPALPPTAEIVEVHA